MDLSSESTVRRMNRYCMKKHQKNEKEEWKLKDNPWKKTKKQLTRLSQIK